MGHIVNSQRWNNYFQKNNIKNIDIKAIDLSCKKLASKLKWKEWRSTLIAAIFVWSIFAIMVANSHGSQIIGGLCLLMIYPVIKLFLLLLRIPFVDYKIHINDNIISVIKMLKHKNIKTNNLIKLGSINLDVKNSVTESISREKLGYALIETNKNGSMKFIFVDTIECSFLAIKEFKIENLQKFVIFNKENDALMDEANKLLREAEQLKIDSKITSLADRSGGINTLHADIKSSEKLIQAHKAMRNMKGLYVLFSDNSQFLIEDLDDDAIEFYNNLKNKL